MTTLAGFYLYTTWKEEEGNELYLEKLGTALAQIYSKNISISTLSAQISNSYPYKGKPIMQAKIENLGNKTIKHLVLKVSFLDFKNDSLYDVEFEPLKYISKKEDLKIPFIEMLIRSEELPIKGNEKIEFTYHMEKCPEEIRDSMEKNKSKPKSMFFKYKPAKDNWSGKLKYRILRVRFF